VGTHDSKGADRDSEQRRATHMPNSKFNREEKRAIASGLTVYISWWSMDASTGAKISGY
jgi:hypothetical protein